VNLGEVTEEDLQALFVKLPRRCIVLLEDIDSAGLKRTTSHDEVTEEYKEGSREDNKRKLRADERGGHNSVFFTGITLSGFLNAIDGIASHEGHVLIMSTNKPESLDAALMRPGRVDVRVAFKNASSLQAADLFYRMYEASGSRSPKEDHQLCEPSILATLAEKFGGLVPDGVFSPAEIQGFLLKRKKNPHQALSDAPDWIKMALEKIEGS
jgi:chaperone BCS1